MRDTQLPWLNDSQQKLLRRNKRELRWFNVRKQFAVKSKFMVGPIAVTVRDTQGYPLLLCLLGRVAMTRTSSL